MLTLQRQHVCVYVCVRARARAHACTREWWYGMWIKDPIFFSYCSQGANVLSCFRVGTLQEGGWRDLKVMVCTAELASVFNQKLGQQHQPSFPYWTLIDHSFMSSLLVKGKVDSFALNCHDCKSVSYEGCAYSWHACLW